MRPLHAVVVGAGPAGAASAFLLARRGWKVTLIERHDSFEREFRGERLMPESQSALRQMGVWDHLRDVPQQPLVRTEVYLDRKRAYSIDTTANGASPLFMSQPAMLRRLVSVARTYDGFEFRPETGVDALLRQGERITGVVVNGEAGREEIECDLVIASDGRGSAMRKLAGLEAGVDLHSEAFDVLWCKIEPKTRWLTPEVSRMYPGRDAMAFVLPAPDGSLQLGYTLPKGAYRDQRSTWVDNLKTLVDPQLAAELEGARPTLKPSLLNVISFTLDRWTQPGLVVIGDAAHPMSPAGGQGIAMALIDALQLDARLGALASESPANIDVACEMLAASRRQEVLAVQAAQKRLATIYLQRDLRSRIIVRYLAPIASRIAKPLLRAVIMGPRRFRRVEPAPAAVANT
jgi:2-polyprenyl-6-methoxyphenol hydroxylase-like FAD-dependent oxidoreductase